ncbi:tetratricopeptide repeat protein [bacterium]|nr:MAG: tetratricopeptide repeat protein [bacterium]
MNAPIFLTETQRELDPNRPGSLLHPSAGFSELVGRKYEVDGLLRFITGKEQFTWLSIFGNGGVGKTRLALEIAHKCSNKGWLAGFVPGDALDRWVLSPEFETWVPSQDTLIIVDNAARKSEILGKLLTRFAKWGKGPANFNTRKIRVILLERRAAVEAGWLGELLSSVGNENWENVHRSMEVPLRLGFPGRDDPDGTMVAILKTAMASWSRLCGKPAPDMPQLGRDALLSLRRNTDYNPVYLQLASLRACEQGSATNIPDWPKGQLLLWAANREKAYIRANCPRTSDHILVERAVANLAFCGARDSSDEKFWQLLRRDAETMGASASSVENTITGLAVVAGKTGEGGRTIFVPIAHDLVNGAFGVHVLSEYREVMEKSLGAALDLDPEQTWLQLIRTTGDLSGVDGFETVRDWLDLVIAERPVEELIWVSRHTSMKNSNLAAFGVALHETLVLKLPQSPAYAPVRADTMNRLSVSNFELGAVSAATEIAKRAVDAYEKLTAENPAYLGRLANCLNNLSAFYAIYGRPVEAANSGARVVDIRRKLLAKGDTGPARAELAGAWTNLAAYFIRSGYYEKAAESAKQGLALWEDLVRKSPQAFTPGLTQSLVNLSIANARAGRYDEALRMGDRATGFLRDLAERNPDAFDSELACALANLAGFYGALGKRQKALIYAEEAAEIIERLHLRNPETYGEDLALTQNNLAAELLRSGNFLRAEKAAKRSVEIYAKLLTTRKMRFAPPYAVALSTLAAASNRRMSPEQALSSATKSAEIHEQLSSMRPEGYTDRNAAVKIILARVLGDVGMGDKGLPVAKQALDGYSKLCDEKPGVYDLDYAAACGHAAETAKAAGETNLVDIYYCKGLEILKNPVEKNPDGAIPLLATLTSAYLKFCKECGSKPDNSLMGYYERVLNLMIKSKKGK